MSRDQRSAGPPENDAAGPSPRRPAPAAESDNSTTSTAKRTTTPRHVGRYACAWRDGFGYGFRDALRLAARRLPPEAWPLLDRLASQYELAGSDG